MKNKGIYFGIDFSISVILIFLCTILILVHFNQTLSDVMIKQQEMELVGKGMFLVDSLIKNSDPAFPLLGAAFYNNPKKRVEQNVLDLELLRKISVNDEISGIFIKSIYIQFKNKSTEKIFDKQVNKNCLGFERFVLLKENLIEKKGKIVVEVCDAT